MLMVSDLSLCLPAETPNGDGTRAGAAADPAGAAASVGAAAVAEEESGIGAADPQVGGEGEMSGKGRRPQRSLLLKFRRN